MLKRGIKVEMDFLKKKLTYALFWLFLVVSFIITIVYSDYPVVDLPFNIDNYLLKPSQSDGILLNLALGYIISAFFYLMLVYYPDSVKKAKVEKVALAELESVCIDAVMLIVLLYKNVCTKKEWNLGGIEDDSQIFDDKFYERMSRFDGYKHADTLQCKVDKDGNYLPITWDERLENEFQSFYDRINQVISRYIFYIDDEIIDKSLSFANNLLIATFLGLPTNNHICVYTGKNNKKYVGRVSVFVLRNDPSGKRIPLFSKTDSVDNIGLLHSYINTLLPLREIIIKKNCFLQELFAKSCK